MIEIKVTGATLAELADELHSLAHCLTDSSIADSLDKPAAIDSERRFEPIETVEPPIAEVAPITPAPDATPPVATHEAVAVLDKEGLPHDERIHSMPATIKTNGCWRGKRNLKKTSPGLTEQVVAELRSTYPLPGTPSPPVLAQPGPPAAATAPPVAAVPVTVTPPVATVDLSEVLLLATTILGHGSDAAALQANGVRITTAMLALPSETPIQSTNDLMGRPDLYPAAYEALKVVAAEIGLQWPLAITVAPAVAVPVAG